MIPVENSIAGRVADVHHLLPSSGLKIVGERFKPIHFQLMANKGAKLEDLKTVQSMAIALHQCRKVVKAAEAEGRGGGDTAGAARMLSERPDPSRAAIARPWRRRSTASTSWPATSRTSTTTPPASW